MNRSVKTGVQHRTETRRRTARATTRRGHITRLVAHGLVLAGLVAASVPMLAGTAHAAIAPINVSVWQDIDSNGSRSTDPNFVEPGIPGVDVEMVDPSGTIVQTLATDANGDLTFGGAQDNVNYRIQVVTPPPGLFNARQGADNNTSVQFANGGASLQIAYQDPNNIGLPTDDELFVPMFAFGPTSYYDGSQPAQYPANTVAGMAFPSPSGGYDPGPPAGRFEVPFAQTGGVYGSAFALGSNFGLAQDHVFVSSYVKRHAGLGPGANGQTTTGAIYRLDPSGTSANAVLWADLSSLLPAAGFPGTGADPHPAPGASCSYQITYLNGAPASSLPTNNETCWLRDDGTYNEVGKRGLGDIELSPDLDAMYTINLASRQLVRVGLTTPNVLPTSADVQGFDLSRFYGDCPNGQNDWRPFGLGTDKVNNQMFLVATCTGQTTYTNAANAANPQTPANRNQVGGTAAAGELKAIVYKFDADDPAGNVAPYSTVLTAPLNYLRRPCSGQPSATVFTACSVRWHPWTTDYRDDMLSFQTINGNTSPPTNTGGAGVRIHPTPLATDVTLVNGDLVVGLRDITGDRWGNHTVDPAPSGQVANPQWTGTHLAIAQGDNLVACSSFPAPNTPAVYTLENNGVCGGRTGAGPGNGDGPGGGEFLFDNFLGTATGTLRENFMGSTGYLPGRPDSLTATGVHVGGGSFEAGVRNIDAADGSDSGNATRLYVSPGNSFNNRFSKSNGLGGLSALTTVPDQVELGNRLWYDDNRNGVQDGGESGVPGARVSLFATAANGSNGPLVGSTTTNAQGEYYFRSNSNSGAPNGGGGFVPVTWTGAAGPPGRRIEPEDGVVRYRLSIDRASDYAPGGPLDGWRATLADVGQAPGNDLNDSGGLPVGSPTAGPAGPAFPTRDAVPLQAFFANDHTNDFGFLQVSQFDLTKHVTGSGAGDLDPAAQFQVTFTCTLNGAPLDLTTFGINLPLTVTGGQTIHVPNLPVGSVCSNFAEVRPDPPPTNGRSISWNGPPVFSPGTVTVGDAADPVHTVDLTNTVDLVTGGFPITKTVTGSGAGDVNPNADFDISFTCTLNNAPVNLGDYGITLPVTVHPGGTVNVDGLPEGTICTNFTEARPDPPPTTGRPISWNGPPVFSPTTVVVGGPNDPVTPVNVTNRAELILGDFTITKAVTGNGAGSLVPGTQFQVSFACTLNSAPVTLSDYGITLPITVAAGQPATITGLPVGTICTNFTEVRPAIPPTVNVPIAWNGPPTFAPTTVTVGAPNDPVAATTVTNRIELVTGSFGITKQVIGSGAGDLDPSIQFRVSFECRLNGQLLDLPSYGIDLPVAIRAGDTFQAPALPTGTVCDDFTETRPDPPPTTPTGRPITWTGPAVFVPTSVTVGGPNDPVQIATLTNQVDLVLADFRITKQVTGNGAGNLDPNAQFQVSFTCTLNGTPLNLSDYGITLPVVVRPGGTANLVGLPTGTVCTSFSEVRPTPPPTSGPPLTWTGQPTFSPTSITIGAPTDPVVLESVTNRVDLVTGQFRVRKDVSGDGAGALDPASVFDVRFDCSLNSSPLDLADFGITLPIHVTPGATVDVTGLPTGTVCTNFTETRPDPPTSNGQPLRWSGPPVFDPTSVAIGAPNDPVNVVTLSNVVQLDAGTFSVTKQVTGNGADHVDPTTTFTVQYECTLPGGGASSGNLSVLVGQTKRSQTFPVGSVCRISEVAPTSGLATGYEWSSRQFVDGAGNPLADANQPVTVTIALDPADGPAVAVRLRNATVGGSEVSGGSARGGSLPITGGDLGDLLAAVALLLALGGLLVLVGRRRHAPETR